MSSPEYKQHNDFVRDRELNALRKLMHSKRKESAPNKDHATTRHGNRFAATRAIDQINALEVQMDKQLFEQGTERTQAHPHPAPYEATQIQAFVNTAQATRAFTQYADADGPTLVQQAAEHFAMGKAHVAQSILEDAIRQRNAQGGRASLWLVLLDLYRVTDQMDRFEALALDYSIQFGRSPLAWVSILKEAGTARQGDEIMLLDQPPDWSAPKNWLPEDLLALEGAVQATIKSSGKMVLDWQNCGENDIEQWRLVKTALNYLAVEDVTCLTQNLDVLERSFDPESEESALANLALLRCQNNEQAFERAAIEYSIKFEISPPDWIVPACRFSTDPFAPIRKSKTTPDVPELVGVIDAERATHALGQLELGNRLTINCSKLVRVDPTGLAAIIRWARQAKAKDSEIELQGLHRLLAAYFFSQNVQDHAKITVRRD